MAALKVLPDDVHMDVCSPSTITKYEKVTSTIL